MRACHDRNIFRIEPRRWRIEMDDQETLVTLTADIIAAHVSNHRVEVSDLPLLIETVQAALDGFGQPAEPALKKEPDVPIRASAKRAYIVCPADNRLRVVPGKSV